MVTEEARLNAAIEDILGLVQDRAITRSRATPRINVLTKDLKRVQHDLENARYGGDPLAVIAGKSDAANIWDTLALDQQRVILRRTARVVIQKAYAPKFFNPAEVRLTWL
jgi:hypothetical protein